MYINTQPNIYQNIRDLVNTGVVILVLEYNINQDHQTMQAFHSVPVYVILFHL